MLVDVELFTGFVLTVKVAVVEPPETETLNGTMADVLLEDSATTAPADGAAALSVTVAVEFVPPATEVGERDRPDTDNATTVSEELT